MAAAYVAISMLFSHDGSGVLHQEPRTAPEIVEVVADPGRDFFVALRVTCERCFYLVHDRSFDASYGDPEECGSESLAVRTLPAA